MPVRTEPGGCAPPPEQTEQLTPEEPARPIQTGHPGSLDLPIEDLQIEDLQIEDLQISPSSTTQNIKDTKEIVDLESADTENQMIRDIPSPTVQDELVEEEPLQEVRVEDQPRAPIYLEDLDPHTQRVIYSALANAPELGLGPHALFASRQTALDEQADQLPEPEPAEPRSLKPARTPPKPINMKRHESHCTICKHPERDAIEQAFLHWWRAADLAYHFKLGHRLVVYRHAKATGLFEKRTAQTTHALGYVIEQAESVTPTADSIIRAIRALSCIDENGRWHEPRKEVLVTHQYLDTPIPLLDTRVENK